MYMTADSSSLRSSESSVVLICTYSYLPSTLLRLVMMGWSVISSVAAATNGAYRRSNMLAARALAAKRQSEPANKKGPAGTNSVRDFHRHTRIIPQHIKRGTHTSGAPFFWADRRSFSLASFVDTCNNTLRRRVRGQFPRVCASAADASPQRGLEQPAPSNGGRVGGSHGPTLGNRCARRRGGRRQHPLATHALFTARA